MLTRYALEFHRGEEKLIFIIVVENSVTLNEVQTALEFQGWNLHEFKHIDV